MTSQEIPVSDPQVNATTDNSAILSGTAPAGTSEQSAGTSETTTDMAVSSVSAATGAGDLTAATIPMAPELTDVAIPTAPAVTGDELNTLAAAAAAASPIETFSESVDNYVNKMHAKVLAKEAEVLGDLDAIEKQALFMGGEVGVDIRNRVCRIRLALTGQSHTEA